MIEGYRAFKDEQRIQAGDEMPERDADGSNYCYNEAHDWICTRPKGHPGQLHVAHVGVNLVFACWFDAP